MDWKEQYKHPKWQEKRLKILERDNFSCLRCFGTEDTLHVHHKYYEKDKMIWEYPDECYLTLCNECHGLEHEEIKIFNMLDLFPETQGTLLKEIICINHKFDMYNFYIVLDIIKNKAKNYKNLKRFLESVKDGIDNFIEKYKDTSKCQDS